MDALYDKIGVGYRNYRIPDPRIATAINAALGDCQTVLNVGAGTGSYEPTDRHVQALEISSEMIAQRKPGAAPCIQGSAMDLPFADKSFDTTLAILTLHHWPDQFKGLQEMKRVARKRCVILTHIGIGPDFWLVRNYFPEAIEVDAKFFPSDPLHRAFEKFSSTPVPIPEDCTDGFFAAYWKRPEMYFNADARRAISLFSFLSNVEPRIEQLRRDIADGRWAARNADILDKTEMDYGYRLVVAEL